MRRALFFAGVWVCLAALPAAAQDPVKLDPNAKHYKVEVENEQVRVLRVHLGPKESSPMHEHPPSVVITLTDVRLRFTLPDGKTEERTATAGSARYRPAVKHAAVNLNDKDFEAIEVELKGKAVATQSAIQSALDPVKLDPKHYKIEVENDQVRVVRWNYGSHYIGPMHEHPAFVAVSLTDMHLKITLPDGRAVEHHEKAGATGWSAGEKHTGENVSDKTVEGILVELKAKPAASKPAA